MNPTDAFRMLELPETASADEIDERYKELMMQVHPDRGGTDEAATLLNAAHTAASSVARNRSLMVPATTPLALANVIQREIATQAQRRETTRETIGQIARRHTSPIKQLRRLAVLAGAVSAGLVGISTRLIPVFEYAGSPELTITFATWGGVALVLYVILSAVADNLEKIVDDLAESLNDKSSFVSLLQDIMSSSRAPWSRSEIEERIADLLSRRTTFLTILYLPLRTFYLTFVTGSPSLVTLARTIGPSDFIKLFLTRGLELGVLREVERWDEDSGTVSVSYDLAARPRPTTEGS